MKPSIIRILAAIIMTATVAFAEEAPQDANSIVKILLRQLLFLQCERINLGTYEE